MIREAVGNLLAKPVTRKEFLSYVGVLLLALVGVSALLRSISDVTGHQINPKDPLKSLAGTNPQKGLTNSYGGGSYGG
ncbi:MAG TPA: hypothetical protein VMQ44_00975 [Candidatus Saccharimonadales bacterium]|nr:hypothetical protein [Candidatus Saccharimonadales bacterium]